MSKQQSQSPEADRSAAVSNKRKGEWELWYRFRSDADPQFRWLNRWLKHRSYPTKEMALLVVEKMKREYSFERTKGRAAEYIVCTPSDRPKQPR